jgi:hypothetical protein
LSEKSRLLPEPSLKVRIGHHYVLEFADSGTGEPYGRDGLPLEWAGWPVIQKPYLTCELAIALTPLVEDAKGV